MTAQLERLIQDSKQLDAYIKKLQNRGNTDRVTKLVMKRQFLNQTIAEFKQQVMQ